MLKRDFLKLGAGATLAGATMAAGRSAKAMDQDDSCSDTGFLFIHGSWHGAWCWQDVMRHLLQEGYQCQAIDLPGHGLWAIMPDAFLKRPVDKEALATEPSSLARLTIKDYRDTVIEAAMRARQTGIKRLVAVGHSMGGVPLTFAAASQPELFSDLVYVASLGPTKGKPAGAYLALPDQVENSLLGAALVGDPAEIGVLRIDPRSEDEGYLSAMKKALAADVDHKLFGAVSHLLTPDAPASIYADMTDFDSGFGRLKKRYIRAIHDKTLVPSAGAAFVDDLNANWPNNRTIMVDIASSHEVMFAQPRRLAELLLEVV